MLGYKQIKRKRGAGRCCSFPAMPGQWGSHSPTAEAGFLLALSICWECMSSGILRHLMDWFRGSLPHSYSQENDKIVQSHYLHVALNWLLKFVAFRVQKLIFRKNKQTTTTEEIEVCLYDWFLCGWTLRIVVAVYTQCHKGMCSVWHVLTPKK